MYLQLIEAVTFQVIRILGVNFFRVVSIVAQLPLIENQKPSQSDINTGKKFKVGRDNCPTLQTFYPSSHIAAEV